MTSAIVGFQFHETLLEGDILPLEQGLSVIYGLNGAGKSRLLRGITSALKGIASDVGVNLVVRVPEAARVESQDWLNVPWRPRDVLTALATALAGPDEFDGIIHETGLETSFVTPESAARIVNRYLHQIDSAEQYPELTHAVRSDRLFAFAPVGTERSPAWNAWLVADPRNEAVAAVLALWNRWEQGFDDGDDDTANQLFDTLDGHSPVYPGDMDTTLSIGRRASVRPFAIVRGVEMNRGWRWVDPILVSGPVDFGLDLISVPTDVNEATRQWLADLLERRGRLGQVVATRAGLTDRKLANALTASVNARLDQYLVDPVIAKLVLAKGKERHSRPSAEWLFARSRAGAAGYEPRQGPTDAELRIEHLSRAERAWAEQAITESLYWEGRLWNEANLNEYVWEEKIVDPQRPALTLIDEPETALHRSGEARVAAAVSSQGADPRNMFVVASHSPEFLDLPSTHLFEVRRGAGKDGRSVVQPLDFGARSSLGELGLVPSDLLRRFKVLLLVEGLHDQVVLDAYLGDELRRARVEVLPLRGAKQLRSSVESGVLFEFTDAHLVALVDNQRADTLISAWEAALQRRVAGSTDEAIASVKREVGTDSEEARYMSEWLIRALERGVESRVTPYGLEARDVVEYVPVRSLVPSATSWDSLRAEHEELRRNSKGTPSDFKRWLELSRAADFTESALRNAVAQADQIPHELTRLLKTLEARSHHR